MDEDCLFEPKTASRKGWPEESLEEALLVAVNKTINLGQKVSSKPHLPLDTSPLDTPVECSDRQNGAHAL